MVKGTNGAPPAAVLRIAAVADELDWDAFSKWYFPDRRRHDLEAVASYAAYRHGGDWEDSRRPPANLTLVPTESIPPALESESDRVAAQRLQVAVAEAHV
jgi:hypothetical protein